MYGKVCISKYIVYTCIDKYRPEEKDYDKKRQVDNSIDKSIDKSMKQNIGKSIKKHLCSYFIEQEGKRKAQKFELIRKTMSQDVLQKYCPTTGY